MRTIVITVDDPQKPCGFDVTENGRSCNGLSWDEMIGQIASMTIPATRIGGLFSMRTPEEWKQWRSRLETKQIEVTE